MSESRVFDSWAIMAFLNNEASAEKVEQLILSSRQQQSAMLITVVNLGEIWYSIARTRSESFADNKIDELGSSGFLAVEVDWTLAHQAARFKSKYKLSYADCFAAALAKLKNIELVTGDRDFKRLQSEVKILWV